MQRRLKAALDAKKQADAMWDRLMKLPSTELSKEKILSAMSVCNTIEQQLLDIEHKISQEKISLIPYDQNSPQNVTAEAQRKCWLHIIEEVKILSRLKPKASPD